MNNICCFAFINIENNKLFAYCRDIEDICNMQVEKIDYLSSKMNEIKCLPEFHIYNSSDLIGKIYGFSNIIVFKNFLEQILEYHGVQIN